jgi:hypothetical protein
LASMTSAEPAPISGPVSGVAKGAPELLPQWTLGSWETQTF